MIASLNLLLGYHLKSRQLGDPKGGRHRDVRRVATPSHDNAPDAGMVVPRINGVPTAIEKDFGPAAEIHGIGIDRNADVAEIAGAIPCGNVHAPAERYGEMRKVAAYTNAFVHGIAGAAGGRGKRGQDGQALGRSRGGFTTKIHAKSDASGDIIAFDLTGGEAFDGRHFETLLDIGPDIQPRAAISRQRLRQQG